MTRLGPKKPLPGLQTPDEALNAAAELIDCHGLTTAALRRAGARSDLRSVAAAIDAAHIAAGGIRTSAWWRVCDDALWALVEEVAIDADPATASREDLARALAQWAHPLETSEVAAAMRSTAGSWASGRRPVTARASALDLLESAAQALNAAVAAYIGALDAALLAGATMAEASEAATMARPDEPWADALGGVAALAAAAVIGRTESSNLPLGFWTLDRLAGDPIGGSAALAWSAALTVARVDFPGALPDDALDAAQAVIDAASDAEHGILNAVGLDALTEVGNVHSRPLAVAGGAAALAAATAANSIAADSYADLDLGAEHHLDAALLAAAAAAALAAYAASVANRAGDAAPGSDRYLLIASADAAAHDRHSRQRARPTKPSGMVSEGRQ